METVWSFINNNLIFLTGQAFIMIIYICFSLLNLNNKEISLLGVSLGLFTMFGMAYCLIYLITLEARPIPPNPIAAEFDGLFKIATRLFVIGVPIIFLFFFIFTDVFISKDDKRTK